MIIGITLGLVLFGLYICYDLYWCPSCGFKCIGQRECPKDNEVDKS